MTGAVIFVHGIGVRGPAYDTTFKVLRDELAERIPDVVLHPCRWGDDLGARMLAEGRSVPDYAHLAPPKGEIATTGRRTEAWARLYGDPWLEIALLAEREARVAPRAPHLPPIEDERLKELRAWRPGAKVKTALEGTRLNDDLEVSRTELLTQPELPRALRHDEALAVLGRALAARAVGLAADRGVPIPSLAATELLAQAITDELAGRHLAPPGARWPSALAVGAARTSWRTSALGHDQPIDPRLMTGPLCGL